MKNPLAIFRQNNGIAQAQRVKDRVLKNREAVLDAMAENIKGARACPYLMGQKCLGVMCEFFREYVSTDLATNKKSRFHRCSLIEQQTLLIEVRDSINRLIKVMESKNVVS